MATIDLNPLTASLRGKLGNGAFHVQRGQTIWTKRRGRPSTYSPAQLEVQHAYGQAAGLYRDAAPRLRETYEQAGQLLPMNSWEQWIANHTPGLRNQTPFAGPENPTGQYEFEGAYFYQHTSTQKFRIQWDQPDPPQTGWFCYYWGTSLPSDGTWNGIFTKGKGLWFQATWINWADWIGPPCCICAAPGDSNGNILSLGMSAVFL